MAGIAALAKSQGHKVTGCDQNVYPPMSTQLNDLDIKIIEGYDANQIKLKPNIFIIGNVISRGNPLIENILNNNLRYQSGPEWLYENILNDKWVLAVAGTHGKTTTSSMLAWILESNGLAPGFLIGGIPKNFKVSAKLPTNNKKNFPSFFVIEADEYDTSFFDKRSKFVHYRPKTLILNNLEFDHADIFPDITYIFREFHHLLRTLKKEAQIIFPNDDSNISKVLEMGTWSKLISYDVNGNHTNSVMFNDDSKQTTYKIDQEEGRIDWEMFGEHNARNAMAAALAVKQYGISLKDSLSSLEKFQGVSKRQDILLDTEDIVIIEDFAHHPTAIKTTLDGLRKKFPKKRLLAAIELRSNTMKSGFHDEQLLHSVAEADHIFWKGDDSEQVKGLIDKNPSKFSDICNVDNFVDGIDSLFIAGDVLLIMSNGNFDNLSKKLLKKYI